MEQNQARYGLVPVHGPAVPGRFPKRWRLEHVQLPGFLYSYPDQWPTDDNNCGSRANMASLYAGQKGLNMDRCVTHPSNQGLDLQPFFSPSLASRLDRVLTGPAPRSVKNGGERKA